MIVTHELPPDSLLRKYRDAGAYTDCYATEIAVRVSHAAYVEAFYTTWVFKLERLLLKWFVAKPSTDDDARRLARGELDVFAAWTVEGRAPDQLLLADFMGRTKSWLMIASLGESHTRLYFGSAVVPGKAAGRVSAQLGLKPDPHFWSASISCTRESSWPPPQQNLQLLPAEGRQGS